MHFRPTAKCVNLVSKLFGEQPDRVYFVVAPYGSGKSLACTYVLHLTENRKTPNARGLLRTIGSRINEVDPALANLTQKRAKSKRQGLVLVLEGSAPNVAEALQSSAVDAMRRCKLGRQARPIESLDTRKPGSLVSLLALLAEKVRAAKLDRIVIVWDEFGRHLEGLVSAGRAAELADVQLLAEAVSRVSEVPISLGVVMHQGFANYAGGLPQSAQAEWRKVEGRFSPIQYVDDSIELYELLGRIVSSLRATSPPPTDWNKASKRAKAAGLFAPFPMSRLAALLEAAWPIQPAVVYLLPRLAARTAQNERTMFGFLYSRSLAEPVTTDDLYEYFAPTMELDRGLGGTYRAWLETESASAKAESQLEVSVLRLATLLTLVFSEERGRLTPQSLEVAKSLGNTPRTLVKKAISDLLSRKLLLHRRHANQLSLWHGTDLDLRGRVETERGKIQSDFCLEEFLSNEFPPPIWKPVVYNDKMAVRRFFRSCFIAASDLRRKLSELTAKEGLPPDSDGEGWYIVTSKQSDADAAATALQDHPPEQRLVIVLPGKPVKLAEPAIELVALQRLALDEELVANDPLALTEIGQMIDDVHKHLGHLVDQLTLPQTAGPRWFHQGSQLRATNAKSLRIELSRITECVFSRTPRINSEMIARRQPSATIVNARKKVCLGILERYRQEKLGLEGEFADSAIFRSVFLGTGLYRRDQQADSWRFARPSELNDPNLQTIWRCFEIFLTEPSKSPKPFNLLFDSLKRPPTGLRAGLFPPLLAAAIKAFPSACSITGRDGSYMSDLLPSVIEAICKEPQDFLVFVPDLSRDIRKLLGGLNREFSDRGTTLGTEDTLITETHNALMDWVQTLPRGALTSRLVSRECRKFQRVLRSTDDPQRLLLNDIPGLITGTLNVERTLRHVSQCKLELERLGATYCEEVKKLISRELGDGTSAGARSILAAIDTWLSVLPDNLLTTISSPTARNFLQTFSVGFTAESVAAERIAVVCTGQTFRHWSDETLVEFRDSFVRNVETIEAEVVELSDGQSETVKTYILRNRIRRLASTLAEQIGDTQAKKYLRIVSKNMSIETGSPDGNDTGRASNA